MQLQLIVLLAGFSLSVMASNGAKLCSRQLREILQISPACAENYFAVIDGKLRQYEPLLFTPQAQAIFDKFENSFGVSITETPTTGSQCNTYSNLNAGNITRSPSFFAFDNSNAPATPITSLSISVDVESQDTSNLRLYLSYGNPPSTIRRNLNLFFGNCAGNTGLVATFEDGGAGIDNNCANLNDGLALLPNLNRSISTSLKTNGVIANTPISLTLTKVNNDHGDIIFNSANLTICSSLYYSYDFARSNLNVPGLT